MLKKIFWTTLLFATVVYGITAQDGLVNMVDGIINSVEGLQSSAAGTEGESLVFRVVNDTGFTVKNVFVCKAGEKNWGKNYLTNNLSKGQHITINLGVPPDDAALYNVRIIDVDGDAYTKYNLEIKRRDRISIGIGDMEF
ncbi:MAG: hypothetical protein FWH41_01815 [Treponema sp.]|nr:hypothetical protein [Treponema sp.]